MIREPGCIPEPERLATEAALEPIATAYSTCDEELFTLSGAISLKRIADALTDATERTAAEAAEPKTPTPEGFALRMLEAREAQTVLLQRIADALTGQGDTANVTNLVQELAWEAGRSFQHGTRTDR